MEFKTKGGCVEWAAHKSTSPLSHIKAAKLSHRRYIIHTQYHTPHSLFHTWLLPWPGLFPEPIHGIVCPLLHRRPPLRTLPKPPPPAAAVGNVVAPAPPPPPLLLPLLACCRRRRHFCRRPPPPLRHPIHPPSRPDPSRRQATTLFLPPPAYIPLGAA